MADQNARQDQNQFPALIAHTGTAGTAETVRIVANSSGAVLVSGTTSISGTIPVSGTVGVSGTTPVSGTVSISGTVPTTTTTTDYLVYMDETTTTNVTYVGKAVTGTSGTAASWQIKKIDETGSGTTLITFAGTTTSYNQVWNNRASLGYG